MFGIKWNNNKAFTIIEVIVVAAVIIAVFVAILGFFAFESKVAERGRMRLKAASLNREAIEAVRNFRDNTIWASDGIGNLNTGANYHPVISGDSWNIISDSEIINEFTRKIVFDRVYRDGNDNISGSGTEDSNTRKVIITISWTDRQGSAEESLITYITNWRK